MSFGFGILVCDARCPANQPQTRSGINKLAQRLNNGGPG